MSNTIVLGVSPSAVSPVAMFLVKKIKIKNMYTLNFLCAHTCSRFPTELSLCLSKTDRHSWAIFKCAEYYKALLSNVKQINNVLYLGLHFLKLRQISKHFFHILQALCRILGRAISIT